MVTYRFKGGRSAAVPAILTKKGFTRSTPHDRGESPPADASPLLLPPLALAPPALPATTAPVLSFPAVSPSLPPDKRERKGRTSADLRQKILDSDVVDVLLDFIAGDKKLSRDQAAAALGLAMKVIPNFTSVPAPRDDDEADDGIPTEIEIRIVDPKT
jgi:hypothetical protein